LREQPLLNLTGDLNLAVNYLAPRGLLGERLHKFRNLQRQTGLDS
jgi:hypothetical protein